MQSTSVDGGLDLSTVFAQLEENSRGLPPPKLVVIEQHSLAREAFTKDGQQKNVHIVVKNTPFVVTVGLTGSIMRGRIVDFSTLTVETHLLYDCEGTREVPYMKQRPVEYKGKVNDKADQMSLDVKISVLSSHCENLCFRLRFQAVDARSGQPIHALSVLSDPIKVISKPDQITKKGAAPAERKRKRTANDAIQESLARIEERQKEHFELLTRMREEARADRQLTQPVTTSSHFSLPTFDMPSNLFGNLPDLSVEALNSAPDQPTTSTSTTLVTLPLALPNPPAATSFETAYDALVDAYLKLPPSERPDKIRRIIRGSSARKTEAFGEMIEIFNAQGLQKVIPDRSHPTVSVSCGEAGSGECPHQQMLAEINNFYNDLLNP